MLHTREPAMTATETLILLHKIMIIITHLGDIVKAIYLPHLTRCVQGTILKNIATWTSMTAIQAMKIVSGANNYLRRKKCQ